MSGPEATPLTELLTRGGVMPMQRALALVACIAEALAASYKKGGPFGLPRPANLLVHPDGSVHFVKNFPSTDAADIAYCSPEEWEGRTLDERSDVFMLGTILFESLCGIQPFERGSVEATREAITAVQRPSVQAHNKEIPDVIGFVVSRCLRKEPLRRYANVDDLRSALLELEDQIQTNAYRPSDHSTRGYRMLAATGLAAMVVAGLGAWIFFSRGDRRAEPILTAIPIMATAGAITGPSFSRDGNQIAFSWNGDRQDNADIYVRRLGAGSVQRLTTHADADVSPVWSPDGRYLAFVRNSGTRAAIFLLPAAGGPERQVHEFTRTTHPGRYRLLDWSPDGRWLAFPATDDPAQGGSLYLLSLANGHVRRLTTSPVGSAFGDAAPAFSQDGAKLAFVRTFTGNVGDVFVLPLKEYAPFADPVRLTTTGAVNNPVWTPDHDLVFTRFQGTSTLWRMRAAAGENAGPMPGIGELGNFAEVAGGRDSRFPARMVYVRSIWDENIWRVPVLNGEAQAGPEAIITSTRRDWEPHIAPNGRLVSFASERAGPAEIFLTNSLGAEPRRLTSIGSFAAAARWSPDGARIAFVTDIDKQYEIYVLTIANGKVFRLTTSPAHETAPSWSRDGKWIYFASNRGGSFQVWRQPPNPSAAAAPVTSTEGFAALESVDGTMLYYTKQSPSSGIWRQPVEGGAEILVVPSISAWGNFDVCSTGIYYSTSKAPNAIEFYDFTTKRARTVFVAPKQLGFGISVSLDGRHVLYTSIDQQANELMLVENFR